MKKELINKMIEEFEERKQVIDGCIQILQIELMKENNQSQEKPKVNEGLKETTLTEISTPDTHSTKGHWEETEYEDGCHTHKDTVWVEDKEQEKTHK